MPLRLLLDRHLRAALLVLWLGLWLWIVYLSLIPIHLPPQLSDKVVHFTGYAVMSAAAVGFCHDRRRLLLYALLAAGLGGAVEIAQAFTPTRSCDLFDFLADAIGAALGCLTAQLWLLLVIDPLRRPAKALRSGRI